MISSLVHSAKPTSTINSTSGFCLLVGLLWLLPFYANAAVIINEVAWMGNVDLPNDEWIELHNTGSSVNVDGWILSDGVNLNISLSGTINSGDYAVLERTDDDSAPGSAFLIYTGALANTGSTLTLRRADNSIEDQVAGGENWSNIGGNNETKDTAQYTSLGWITALATPGAVNQTSGTPPSDEDDEENEEENNNVTEENDDTNISTKKSNSGEIVSLELPNVELTLAIDAPNTVYVNQPFSLSVSPSGLGETIMDSLVYTWNLGDLSTKSAQTITHSYGYPGEYAVVVEGAFSRHSQLARHNLTVLPVKFTITRSSKGDVQINNNAKYEVNLSGYTIKGSQIVTLPENTMLLPQATLTIPKDLLGVTSSGSIVLRDQTGTMVAREPSAVATKPAIVSFVPVLNTQAQSASLPLATNDKAQFNFVSDVAPLEEFVSTPEIEPTTTVELEVKASTSRSNSQSTKENKLPYFGLIGVLSVALLFVYGSKK